MFNLFKLFKKKPKKQYKLSEFSFRRVHRGRTQVYHTATNEWLTWHLIVDDVFDAAGEHVTETDLHHALIDTIFNVTHVGCDFAKSDDTSRTVDASNIPFNSENSPLSSDSASRAFDSAVSNLPSGSSSGSSWSSAYDSGSSSSCSSSSDSGSWD
ncbi:hypothetical protein [Pseudoalteromonas piscicida]|uniref:Uncharacterized protein n=1 Tax=Pseudoalteromonas piscicida TaxID=43662 RepID=A0A2A5JLZ3_PSEO7|nr:hypothetical protein [Pseudoalteromonas piscicida]PCK30450.1 hypothetical protein CEX98_17655 [Pseudoalteromonas piscicida]